MKKLFFLLFSIFAINYANAQWFWQNPLPQGNTLYSVCFIDTNIGFAVGWEGTIIKTTNGGNNWMIQKIGTSDLFFSVCFTDINTGYVVGYNGTISKTTDGGNIWIKQTSGTYRCLYSVHFVDKNTGYAVGT